MQTVASATSSSEPRLTRREALIGAALATGLVAAGASAQSHVPTVTRLVKQFMGFEGELADALRGGDSAALARLVVDDFEQREGDRPGEPLPRAEWVQQEARVGVAFADIEQMAVHDYGEVMAVSFLRVDTAGKRRQFVVDVWKRHADGWKLATRYLGAVATAKSPEAPVKKKY